MIKRSIPRYSQPQYPVRVDQSNPLVKGINRAYGYKGFEHSLGTLPTEPVGSVATSKGIAQNFTGGSERAKCSPLLVTATGFSTFTLLIPGFASTSGTRQGIWHTQATEGSAQDRLRLIWLDATSGFYLDTNGGFAYSHKPTFAAGDILSVGYSRSGTTTATNPYYINGTKVTPVQNSEVGTTGTPAAASPMFLGADVETATWGMVGKILLHIHFDRVLTDAEFALLHANPWQIFEPRKQNIYVSAASSGTTVSVPAGTLTITGYTPTVATSDHKTVSVPAGSLTLSGFAPTVSASSGTTIAVPAGSLTLTGYAPVIVNPHTISIPLATLSLTGYAPTVLAGVTVSVPAGSLSLTGYAPTVINPVSISIPAGSLTLSGFAPTVSNGAGITISVQNATLALTGFAPAVAIESMWRTVSASGGVWVDASAASGTWTEV